MLELRTWIRWLALAALALPPESRAQDDPWVPLGPAPIPNGQTLGGIINPIAARAISIAIHPTNPDLVYVGTAGGGLYRSSNGGASWTHLMDGAQSLVIGALALAPSSPETLYVGTGEPQLSSDSMFGVGVYRIDNASSPTPTVVGPFALNNLGANALSGRAVSEIQVHPTDPATIFVSTVAAVGGSGGSQSPLQPSRGVHRSTNATSASPTFTRLTGLAGNADVTVRDIVIDPGNPNRLVASVSTNIGPAGIHVSNDALAASPAFAQTLVMLGSNPSEQVAEFAIQRTIGAPEPVIYAATGVSTGTLYRSTDGGASWLPRVDNNFCSPQCFYDIAVAVDPFDPDRVYLGGSATLTFGISTNGGTSFTASNAGLHPWSHAVAVAPSNSSVLYLGSEGGIFRSNDAGASWVSLNNATFDAAQIMDLDVHPTDPTFTLAAGVFSGALLYRSDATWRRVDGGGAGRVLIDQSATTTTATNLYHLISANQFQQAYRFIADPAAAESLWTSRGCNGGSANGIVCNGAIQFYAPLARGPGSPNTTYLGSDRLYRSNDTGLNHTVVSQNPIVPGIPLSAIGVSPLNDLIRVVGLRNGALYGTSTGATLLDNLDPVNVVPDQYVASVTPDPGDPDTVYVTLSAYNLPGVWRTANLSDGIAASWEPVANGLPQVPVNALAIDPDDSNVLYAGTEIGVFGSADLGATWVPFGTGLPRVPVHDVALTIGGKLRIGTFGRGVWETDAGFADGDGDGVADLADNCPHEPNPSQADVGGLRTGSPPDGIGDACQCGDANGDGVVAAGDIAVQRAALANPAGALLSPGGVARCNVIGGPGPCGIREVAVVARALQTIPLAPGVAQVCAAAAP